MRLIIEAGLSLAVVGRKFCQAEGPRILGSSASKDEKRKILKRLVCRNLTRLA